MAWTTPNPAGAGAIASSTDYNALKDDVIFCLNGKAYQQLTYTPAGSYTTTSTSFVDIDATNLIITKSITSAQVQAWAFFSSVAPGSAGVVEFDFIVDGTTRFNSSVSIGSMRAVTNLPMNMFATISGLTVASHTFKLQWKVTSGTAATLAATAPIMFGIKEL